MTWLVRKISYIIVYLLHSFDQSLEISQDLISRDFSRPILGPNMKPIPNATDTPFFPISNLIFPKILHKIPNLGKLM